MNLKCKVEIRSHNNIATDDTDNFYVEFPLRNCILSFFKAHWYVTAKQ